METNNANLKQDISIAMMLLRILRKRNMVNGQTYEKVYKLYEKMLKEVA